jgi:hypothetical protein
VVLALRTTGLDVKTDELLSLTLTRPTGPEGDGEVLFTSLIKPRTHATWPDAQDATGITPQDVENAPYVEAVRDQVLALVPHGTLVVGYGLDFDLDLLKSQGINLKGRETFDVMLGYSHMLEPHVANGERTIVPLEACARDLAVYAGGYGTAGEAATIARCFCALSQNRSYRASHELTPRELAIMTAVALGCLAVLIVGIWALVTIPACIATGDKDGLFYRALLFFVALFVFPVLYGIGSAKWN